MPYCPDDAFKGSDEEKIYEDFSKRADDFVKTLLKEYKPAKHSSIKVIHDPVWGTMKFYPWELQILDSPILQRLRDINQLGLVFLTYPSARHSRFEHTLGVTSLVTKMTDSINDGYYHDSYSVEKPTVSRSDLNKMRMAAILHDIGHCFFSHLSERMYGTTKEFNALKSSFDIFKPAQPHEIFGYIIINTETFKNFFFENVDYPEKIDKETFFDDLGRMIIGAPINRVYNINGKKVKKIYLTEMINGQFDADSLDYLRRDSYITGLSLTYHIDRFLYKIKILDKKCIVNNNEVTERHLTVSDSGVSTVEEMIFGKQTLTRYIYQHQKVLASDVLAYDIVDGLRFNGKLQHPCDFLYYCDSDIYKIHDESADPDLKVPAFKMPIHKNSSKTIADAVKRIKTRDLPKKALVINMANLSENYTLHDGYDSVRKAFLKSGFRNEVYKESLNICDRAGLDKSKIDLFDIYYSVPKPSTAKNYTDVYVATNDGDYTELSDIADLNDWADEFSARSWNAYVFSSTELRAVISLAAENVLKRRGICFNEEKIFDNLKHLSDILRLKKLLEQN